MPRPAICGSRIAQADNESQGGRRPVGPGAVLLLAFTFALTAFTRRSRLGALDQHAFGRRSFHHTRRKHGHYGALAGRHQRYIVGRFQVAYVQAVADDEFVRPR